MSLLLVSVSRPNKFLNSWTGRFWKIPARTGSEKRLNSASRPKAFSLNNQMEIESNPSIEISMYAFNNVR